jgi:hypothetical protein
VPMVDDSKHKQRQAHLPRAEYFGIHRPTIVPPA